MITHVQTGNNALQTAIASCLNMEVDALPPQEILRQVTEHTDVLNGFETYEQLIQGYLFQHHYLRYVEVDKLTFRAFTGLYYPMHVQRGPSMPHLLAGDMTYHTVVATQVEEGVASTMVWDPHHSQSGLTTIERYGVFASAYAEDSPRQRWAADALMNDPAYLASSCLCPICGTLPRVINLARQQGYNAGEEALQTILLDRPLKDVDKAH